MAVSTTTTFTLNRDDIITYALRKLGVIDIGVTPDPVIITNSALALNMMIKSWIAKGVKLWTISELTVPLVNAKNLYTMGVVGTDVITNKPMRLLQAWLRNVAVTPSNDIPLQLLAKHDYNILGSKLSTGIPNSVFLDVLRDTASLYTYPTPDITAATNMQLHLVVQRPLLDVALATDNVDFPTEWLTAIGWNLAAELATDFGVDAERLQYIEAKATKALMEMEDWDIEQTSVYFVPDSRYYR